MDVSAVGRSTLRDKGQLTIPIAVQSALHVEAGDDLEFVIEDDRVVMRGLKAIPADQAWFWTQTWQRMEAEATEDLAAGRTTRYESAEEFLSSLGQ
jgi:bifunctional DNA-binding transcriptional regulator/antitoxin component of YhaV-PrlF toxin-antitoxin module